MNPPRHVDLRETISEVIRLAVGAFAFGQVLLARKRARSRERAPSHAALGSASLASLAQGHSDAAHGNPEKRPASAVTVAGQESNRRVAAKRAAEGEADKAARKLREESYFKGIFHLGIAAAKEWIAHRASSKGAALALYTLFSLAPLLVLILTIGSFFLEESTVRQLLLDQMSSLMGAQGADAGKTMLEEGAQQDNSGWIAGLISTGLVLISATTAFGELKDSLDELWEVPPSGESGLWSMIRERFLSFGLILVLVFMLLATLAISTLLSALNTSGGGDSATFLKTVSLIISHAVSFLVVTGLFAVIFRYLPAVKLVWKDVLIGAVITAVLFYIGKFLIGLYIAKADVSSAYGAAGSVVVMILWIYYSAQIFFYGALFTHEYAMKLGSRYQAQ